MKTILNIEGEKIDKVKGNNIDGVEIVLKDGRVFGLDSNLYGDFIITKEKDSTQKSVHSIKRESSIYVLPVNLHAYRRQGELPKVVGVVMFKPSGDFDERMCYKAEYHSDGFVDYIPMSGVEIGDYKLITQEQCDKELLKEITNDNL